jgi:FtsP/CotA-like multicopper oxidase with cupredoxin domain
MNARQTIRKLCRTSAPLVLALPLAAGHAVAATYDLVVLPFAKPLPGGAVTMWGYALDGASPVPTVPGPPLVVPAGDTSLTVNLRNGLSGPGAEPVSIVIPGQAADMAPVKFTDAAGRQRVRSFTAEAAVAGTPQSYTWNNLKPGTYLYHSGTHPQVQVQMGLYGAMSHDAATGQAYPGLSYDHQVTLLFSEVDPALHAAVAAGQYGPGLAMTSTLDYAPRQFLVNGEPHTGASLALAAGNAGQTTLLRLLNAGLQNRAPMLQGMHMRLMAEDGNKYPHAREQYAAFLPALKTVDAVITPAAAATYPIYDRRLAVTNPGPSGSVAGGMLAFLTVAAGAPGTPLAGNDAYATDEDTALAIAAPGVLGNDSAGTTASLLSGPSHGSLALAANGGFGYTPLANYHGGDSFTYRAMNGAVASLPATVSLTVNPINDVPVAANNAYSVAAGATLNVAAPGVLGNDSDVDGNPLTAVNASALAGLSLSADGSLVYNAPASAGSYPFTYQASDGTASSAAATVTFTVLANRAPVAVNDTVNAPVRRSSPPYTPATLNVLANDSDPDGNLYPATLTIVTPPNKGGTLTIVGNGSNSVTLAYTPKLNFRGSENFSYRVRDSAGATSNTATVKVNVK